MNRQWLSIPWWKWIVGIDLFLVISTVFLVHYPSIPILHYLNLGGESNLAAWWSGISLLIAALLCYELYNLKQDGTRISWLILALIFVVLSWDEIGSLHERIAINSMSDYYPYAVIGVILLTYALGQLFLKASTQKSALLILSGFMVFSMVVLQEHFEHAMDWPDWLLGIRTGVEEGSELFGKLLCLIGICSQRHDQERGNDVFSALFCNPKYVKYLPTILLVGVLLHLGFCVWIPQLHDLPNRGNPALWYPVAVYFILCSQAAYNFVTLKSLDSQRNIWQLFSADFLIFSALICMYKYPLESLSRLYILHFFQLLIISYLYRKLCVGNLLMGERLTLECLALLIVLSLITKDVVVSLGITGVFAYVIANLILNAQTERHQLMFSETSTQA
jgi:hypothetical protein